MVTRKAGTIQGIILILPITLTVMGAVLLAPIMPLLMQAFGHIEHADYLVPILISIPALCIALGAPLAGWMADKVGRRKLLIWAIGLYSVCGVLPLFITTYPPLLLSRIGVGLCEAIIITCSTTLIGDYFSGAQRDKWLGSQAALASLTAMLLFPVAGWLGQQYGWQGPFAIYGLAFLFMIGVIVFTWDVTKQEAAETEVAATPAQADMPGTQFPWAHMVKVCFFTLVGGVMFYILQFQLSSALATFDIQDTGQAGLMLAVASIGVPAGAIAYRYIHKLLNTQRLILLEFAILALGFFGMSQADTPLMLIITGFINQFGAGMVLPTMLTWAVSPLIFSFRGRGTGIWQSTFAIGQFVSTVSFSFVLQQVGGNNFQGAFMVFSVVAAAMCVMTLLLIKPVRPVNTAMAL